MQIKMDKTKTSFNYDLLKTITKKSILIMALFLIFSCNKCEIKDGVYTSEYTTLFLKRMGSKYEIQIDHHNHTKRELQTKFMILNCEDKEIQAGYEHNTVIFNEEKLFFLTEDRIRFLDSIEAAQRNLDSLAALEATMVW
jgi:hypothetical protein